MELKEFNIDTLPNKKVITIFGKKATGKTNLVLDILRHKEHDITEGSIITTYPDHIYEYKRIPQRFVQYDKYTNDILKRNTDTNTFIVLDDCIFDYKNPDTRDLFLNSRCYNKLSIITMQLPLALPPDLRVNIDYVFLFSHNDISIRKRLYEHYAGLFPSFEVFEQTFDKYTENHGCLVINNRVQSNNIEDIVFWYKAPLCLNNAA